MFPVMALLIIVFVTGCKKDETPVVRPEVISTVPLTDAASISISSALTAVFSEEMNPATITSATFVLMKGSVVVPGTVTYSGTTATFTPTAVLAANSLYNATITTAAQNKSGLGLDLPYLWSFTTGAVPDVTSPVVSTTDPATSSTSVAGMKVISTVFSEAMNASTITGSTFTLAQGSTAVAGAVAYSGMTATFTPSARLLPNTLYTATITTGAKDLAGNSLAGNKVWTFTTDVSPTISSTSPIGQDVGVSLSKVVTAVFSTPMKQSTINSSTFTVKQGNTAVAGVVSYTGTTASFDPTYNLLPGLVYTATITTGAESVNGFPLVAALVWSFTTETVVLAPGAVSLGASANYVILAKTAISNISTSSVTGNLGLSPAATSYITGFSITNATGYATSAQVTGKIYAADMAAPTGINLTTAVENMITAYNDAAGRPTPDFLELATGNIGGRTLIPGLYKWTTAVTIPSDITISGGANDVWIFQIAQNLNMSNGVRVTLTGGAQAKNIFWQVAGQATFGTTSHFEGIILSMTGITFQTGASFKGRALAQTAVILDGNAIILP